MPKVHIPNSSNPVLEGSVFSRLWFTFLERLNNLLGTVSDSVDTLSNNVTTIYDSQNNLSNTVTSVYNSHNSLSNSFTNFFPVNDDGTVWDDLRFPATQGKLPGVNDPTYDATNVGFTFTNGVDKRLDFIAQMPHEWKIGSNIRPHVHWQAKANTAGNVVWLLQYSWFETPENQPAFVGIGSTANVVAAVNFANARVSSFGNITPPASALESSILKCQLIRRGSIGSDTYSGDVLLDEFDVHYQKEKLGTSNYSPSATLNAG